MKFSFRTVLVLLITLACVFSVFAQENEGNERVDIPASEENETGQPQVNKVNFFTRITGLFADRLLESDLFTIGARLTYDDYNPLPAARIDFYRDNVLTGSAFTDASGYVLFNSSFNESRLYLVNVSFPGSEDTTGFGILNFLPSFNFTILNSTRNSSEILASQEIVQQKARVGEPVKWVKKIKIVRESLGEANVSFDIPSEGENVIVSNEKEQRHILPREKRKAFSVMLDLEPKNRTFEFTDLVDGENDYVVEFETSAPQKREEARSVQNVAKRISVFSNVSMHYENVTVSTEVKETALSLSLFHIVGGAYIDITKKEEYDVRFIDGDNDGLVDLVEWTVPHLSEQVFELGVATVNTNKPIYRPGEMAAITMVVLDRQGHLVSDAEVILNITSPANESEIFSTMEGTVTLVSGGIYSSSYLTSLEGNYSMIIKASGINVDSLMVSGFEARQNYAYGIIRNIPVSVDPWQGAFKASIAVTPLESAGLYTFTEVVPVLFNITDNGGAVESVFGGKKMLTWTLEGDSVVSYLAIPPLVSPEMWDLRSFISSEGEIFDEARPFYLAVDPQEGYLFSGVEAVDVALCPITNTSFAMIWIESGADPDDNIRIGIYNTDGTVNQTSISVFGHATNASRVDCSTINRTHFVVAWYIHQPLSPLNTSIYDVKLNRLLGPVSVDAANGNFGDVAVSVISNNVTGFGWVGLQDGDYNYRWWNISGSGLGTEVNIDTKMGLATSLSEVAALVAISGNRAVAVWFDDKIASNPMTSALIEDDNTVIIGQTKVGTIGETGRISAAALRGDRVAYGYFNSTDYGIWIRVDDFSGDALANVLQPTKIEANASDLPTFTIGRGISTSEIEADGASMFAVAWFDGQENSVKAAVFDSDGVQVTAPFTVSSVPDNSYRIIDIIGSQSNRNVSLCNGTFVVALSNSTNVAEFKAFRTDGSAWDGRCVAVAPNVTLVSPLKATWSSSRDVTFTYNVTTDDDFSGCRMFTNMSGSWAPNSTNTTRILNDTVQNLFLIFENDYHLKWNVECNDSRRMANMSLDNFTLYIDTIPPIVNLTLFRNNSYLQAGDSLLFNFTLIENANDTCELWGNFTGTWQLNQTLGRNIPAREIDNNPKTINFLNRIDLGAGEYVWNVWCNDSAKNTAFNTNNFTLKIDEVDPFVGIFAPLNNTFNQGTSINITFNFADDNLDACELWANTTGIWALDHAVSYSQILLDGQNFTFNAFNGHFMVNVTCNDSSSRYTRNASYYSVIIDDAAPVINFINVTGNQNSNMNWTAQSDIRFYVNATENNTDSCVAYINTTAGWARNATFNYAFGTLSESSQQIFSDGSYQFNVSCNDSAAQSDFSYGTSIVFNVDTVAPTVAIRSPENNSHASTNNIFIAFGVTDNNLINCSLHTNATGSFMINYSAAALNLVQEGYNFSLLGMHDSNYLVNVICYDAAGNYSRNASYWTVVIDAVPPFINFINATGYANNNWSAQANIQFYVNATDNNTESCRIFTNATGAWSVNASFGYISDALSASSSQMFADGSYLWNVTCNDSAANINFSYGSPTAIVFNVDTMAPLVAVSSPLNGSHNSSAKIAFRFDVTEDNLANCSLYTNATGQFLLNYSASAASLQESGYNFTLFSMHNASYMMNITCFDRAANYSRNASYWTFTIDTAPPFINFINATGYSNNNWSAQSNIFFGVIANDASPQNCTVFTNATGAWRKNVTFGYSAGEFNVSAFQIFADGSYLWNITCNDSLAFFNESYGTSVVLSVDTVAPLVALQSPLNDSVNGSSTVTFRFSMTEDNLANCSLYTNATGIFAVNYSASASGLADSGYNFTLWNMHDAPYSVNITCFDKAGNYSRNASYWTITVDTLAPAITLHNPINDFNTSNTTVAFNWTANDNIDSNLSCDITVNGDVNASDIGSLDEIPISFALPGVGDGFNYWNITCRDGAGNLNVSATQSFVLVKGPAIMNISFAQDNKSVVINWSNVTYADYYDIYISTNHTQFFETPNATGIRDANWTDVSANESQRRYYKISSVRTRANATSIATAAKDLIVIHPGWNMVSIPLSMNTFILKNATNSGFDPLVYPHGCISEIWRYNNTFPNVWEETVYNNGNWAPVIGSENFTYLEPGRGYWMYNNLSQDCNISLSGSVPLFNTTLAMVQDFNLIGWYSQDVARLPVDCENPYPFNVSPANAVAILFYYNETESQFKGTMHFTSSDCGGDESWGWFPDSSSSEFTHIQPGRGYYAAADVTSNWVMESSR